MEQQKERGEGGFDKTHDATWALSEACKMLQNRESACERLLRYKKPTPENRQRLREILSHTRWQILKLKLILRRKEAKAA